MRFLSAPTVLYAALLGTQLVSSHELKPRRTSSILIDPAGQPSLPSAPQAAKVAATKGLNLSDVQGDILVGMKKKVQLFFFFGINSSSVTTFKSKLASDIHPLVTSTSQLLSVSTQPNTLLNIAFSHSGLKALGVTGSNELTDSPFSGGQAKDATNLNDPGTTNWLSVFKNTDSLHGVFLLASDTADNINATLANIKSSLGDSITEIYRLQGQARPGDEEGHEHFGFLDGVSQPAVDGFVPPNPGQTVVPAGTILVGEDPDSGHPAWAKDGSFLAFRQLQQFVPEFNKFLTDNPVKAPGISTPEQGSALMGARMVGRWKSGAPIELSPVFDDPALGRDKKRNNNFNFTLAKDQSLCPFSAHIRKTNPRADLSGDPSSFPKNHILRSGIPYGPEVTASEATSNTTSIERGLAFVAYQSNIANGFKFLQRTWANNPGFFNHPSDPGAPGFDPIIGANKGLPRNVTGLDPSNEHGTITIMKDFIESRGGEYFFSPSLSAIVSTLAV